MEIRDDALDLFIQYFTSPKSEKDLSELVLFIDHIHLSKFANIFLISTSTYKCNMHLWSCVETSM